MKKWKKVFIILGVLFLLSLFCSGPLLGDNEKETWQTLEPANYFPFDIGREWTYEIKIGKAEPISYEKIFWPTETKVSIRRFTPLLREKAPTRFILKIKTEESVAKQGFLEYPIEVKLKIEKDELGIFEGCKEVVWGINTHSEGPVWIEQVITYLPTKTDTPKNSGDSLGQDNGYSRRLLFFGAVVGMGIEISSEFIFFVGIEFDVSGYKGIPCLHFQRVVKLAREKTESILNKNLTKDTWLTEDTWFAKEIGLVRLIQKIGNKTSMTWTLK